jgi:outer membrane lipoprotein-sorting protein
MRRVHWVLLGLLLAVALTFWLTQVRPGAASGAASMRASVPSTARVVTSRATRADKISSPSAMKAEDGKPSSSSSDIARAGSRRVPLLAEKINRPNPSQDAERTLTADEILQAMREKYAQLTSYTDRGRHTRTWHDRNQTYVDVPFRTFFKRPLFYRFEWLGERMPYQESYWSNPAGVFVKKSIEAPYRMNSLQQIFKPSLIPASYHILQFLAPAVVPMEQNFFMSALRLDDDAADGVPCFHLAGKTALAALDRELWIGKEDFLLRRVSTVTPHAYNMSSNPRYFSGRETSRVDYCDVAAEVGLPDELFYLSTRETIGTKN